MFKSISFPITESSQVGEARRAAHRLAEEAGLNESERGNLNIIVSELGTNLHKHALHGEIILRRLQSRNGRGIEVLSVDRGPGMTDVNRCLEDGYSTSGTRGNGLGSIKRMSTVFDVYTGAQGSVFVSQLWQNSVLPEGNEPDLGAICLPYPGETLCGDAWSTVSSNGSWKMIVADGLGHGSQAAEAAGLAASLFSENSQDTPQGTLPKLHAAMRATRGAAVLILQADLLSKKIICAGIGNITAGSVQGEQTKSFVSLNGTLGHQVHRFQEFIYDWPASSLLVVHSDGLQTKWKLSSYPGLQLRHPSLAAAVLYRDFRRTRDDVTVIVARDGAKRA